jgi:isocitrate dehydrogenase (NAD+)
VEFEAGKPQTSELINYINSLESDRKIKTGGDETGVSIKPMSISGTQRIVRCAFEYAQQNGRKKVTAVHKANIQPAMPRLRMVSLIQWRMEGKVMLPDR